MSKLKFKLKSQFPFAIALNLVIAAAHAATWTATGSLITPHNGHTEADALHLQLLDAQLIESQKVILHPIDK